VGKIKSPLQRLKRDVIRMNNELDDKLSLDFDELAPYLKKHTILNVDWTNRPLFGVLVRYDSKFLVLEKKNGKIQTIRRKAVLGIEEDREHGVVQVDGIWRWLALRYLVHGS
jgi:hypothetical protein